MNSEDVRKAMGKPQLLRLKALGSGIRVGSVVGSRVLVKTVIPYTDMDRVEKEGMLVIPESVKKDNTPLPSTGVILQVGELPEHLKDVLFPGVAVLFSRFAGTNFVCDHDDFRILDYSEILCTLIDSNDVIVPIKED